MIDLTTILQDLKGAAIVIAVLIAAAVIIKLIVSAIEKARGRRLESENVQGQAAAHVCTQNTLKLVNVDEKTAALLMAIVSHESGIPLPELVFTSIKLI